MVAVGVFQDLLLHGLKIVACGFARTDLVHHHHHLRAGGQGIENVHLTAGIGLHVDLGRLLGCIVGAGQVLGNGQAADILGIAEGLQPLAHVGAGGAGLAGVTPQALHHFRQIQVGVIHIFPVSGDLHGHGGVVVIERQDIAGRVANDSEFHDDPSYLFIGF